VWPGAGRSSCFVKAFYPGISHAPELPFTLNHTSSPNSAIELNTKSTFSRKLFTEILAIRAETHSKSACNSVPSTDKTLLTRFSLSSLSGDRIWRACDASNGEGKGIVRELTELAWAVRRKEHFMWEGSWRTHFFINDFWKAIIFESWFYLTKIPALIRNPE
jgi:hypothetical protein